MADTCSPVPRHVMVSRALRPAYLSVRSRGGGGGVAAAASAEGPSCIFVGPVETASQETLEALYVQARDAYYSGTPLIVDDMFDRVEMKLRWYRSKSVVKYPRCSLRRQSAYADAEVLPCVSPFLIMVWTCTVVARMVYQFSVGATMIVEGPRTMVFLDYFARVLIAMNVGQEDTSQALALASVWIIFLAFGGLVCALPVCYAVGLAYYNAFGSDLSRSSKASLVGVLATANGILFMAVGSLVGFPIVSSSVKVLQGLWRNDLVALRGACPNCGEEVFAFVKSDQSNASAHRADCHVCESLLEFRTKAEKTISDLGRRWVYGRIYLLSRRRQRWK